MATITFEAYIGAGPGWADIAANTLVFSASLTDLATNVTVATFQDGTHVGNGDPGTDQCGANHARNVKYLTGSTMSINGAGSEAINDTNLTDTECTIRFRFTHGSNVDITNARAYAFNGSVVTTPAVGVDVVAFERGESATAWTTINDDTTSGVFTTGSIGGDNTSERLDLVNKSATQDAQWYCAISVSPETVGGKASFDFGLALTYS